MQKSLQAGIISRHLSTQPIVKPLASNPQIMRKRIYLILTLTALMLISGCAPGIKGKFKITPDYPYDSHTRVAVMPFAASGEVEDYEAEKIANLISTELIPYYVMVEREQINKVMAQLGFEIGGAVSDTTLPELGKMLGVQTAILGKIFEYKSKKKGGRKVYRISANIRMVDIETSALIWSINCKLEHGADSMHDFCEIYAEKFARKLHQELNRPRKNKGR